jgi:hypothetical protein
MKTQLALIALAAALICSGPGCASNSGSHARRYFRDEPSINVVLHFYRWDSIQMTRPDTREGGFLPIITRTELAEQLQSRVARRDAAVVVIGYSYSDAQLAAIANEWKQLMADQGFQRLTLLRGSSKKIDGLPVLEETSLAALRTPSRGPALAALPVTTPTDTAKSPTAATR